LAHAGLTLSHPVDPFFARRPGLPSPVASRATARDNLRTYDSIESREGRGVRQGILFGVPQYEPPPNLLARSAATYFFCSRSSQEPENPRAGTAAPVFAAMACHPPKRLHAITPKSTAQRLPAGGVHVWCPSEFLRFSPARIEGDQTNVQNRLCGLRDCREDRRIRFTKRIDPVDCRGAESPSPIGIPMSEW